jgi:hypothetical protein
VCLEPTSAPAFKLVAVDGAAAAAAAVMQCISSSGKRRQWTQGGAQRSVAFVRKWRMGWLLCLVCVCVCIWFCFWYGREEPGHHHQHSTASAGECDGGRARWLPWSGDAFEDHTGKQEEEKEKHKGREGVWDGGAEKVERISSVLFGTAKEDRQGPRKHQVKCPCP